MHDLNAGGNKSIQEVEKLRRRVAKLERVNRKLANPKNIGGEFGKALAEWEMTFNATRDSIMVIGRESKIIRANLATSRLLGKPLEKIVGKTCWQVVHETEESPEECVLKNALYSKNHEEAEIYVPGKDIWLQVSADPILDEKGNIDKIVHIMRDITERKKAELLLRKERDKAQKYLDVAAVMLIAVDSEQRVGLINKKGCEILGYAEEEILGKNWFDNFVPEKIREKVRAVFKKVIQSESNAPEYNENHVLTKSGDERMIAWHNTFLRNEKGNVIATLSSGEDITERRKVQEALHASEQKYRDLFENAGEGIITLDLDGRITGVNKLVEEYGFDRAELLGRKLFDFVTEYDKARSVSDFQALIAGRRVQGQMDVITPKGIITVEYRDTPIVRRGEIIGVQIILTDITERKRAEEAYRSLVDHSLQGLAIFQEGYIVFTNQAMAKITGYSVQEMLASPPEKVQSFVHPDDRELVWNRYKARLNGEKLPEQYEIRGIRKDGTLCWLEIHASLIEYQGKPAIQTAYIDITERKRAEETLRASEEKYRMIFNRTPAGIAISTIEGKIIDVNKAQAEMIGATVEELKGRNVNEYYVYPDKRKVMVELFKKTGKVTNYEMELKKKDGSIIVELINLDLFKIGNEKYLFATGRDITERKRSNEAYRSLVDHSLQGLAIFQDGRIVFANQVMAKIIGYTLEEMLAAPPEKVQEFVHPDDRELVWNRHRERLLGKSPPERYEFRSIRKDGSILWLEINASLVKYHGKPAIQAAYIDITERKQAEEALRYEKDFANSLIETAPALILVLDTHGRIVDFNPYMEKISGYRLEEVRGKDWFSNFIPERDQKKIKELFLSAMVDIQTRGNINPIITKDGQERDIEWYDKAIKDANGSIVGLLSVGQDITERKKAEEALEQKMRELNIFVDNIPHMAWLKDSNSNIILANQKYGDVVGMDPEYLRNNTCAICFGEETAKKFKDDDRIVIEGKKKITLEETIVDKDGKEIFLETTKSPIFNDTGDVIGTVGIAVDISERKQAEEALRESEDRFKHVFNYSAIGKSITLLSGEMQANKAFSDMLGYSEEEFSHVKWQEITHPDDVELSQRAVDSLLTREKNSARFIKRYLHKNGSVVTADVTTALRRDANDNPIYLMVSISDITERLRSEEKIKLFSDAINSAFDCFILTDENGNITYVNETARRMFGYTHEEFLKLNIAKLDADPEFVKKVEQEVTANGKWSGEVTNIRKNGGKFPCLLSAFIIKDDKGNSKGTMGILRDITERKQAEHREKEYISHLQYLFESATEFVKLTPVQDIYTLIAKKIYELNKGCIVAVNIFDEVSGSLCVRALVGLGKYTEAVSKIMGTNPVGRCFPLDDAAREGLGRGRLLKIPGGIYDLSPGIPKVVCQAIAKLLGLGDVYAMGLNSEGRLYGSVTILTRSNTGLKNQDLIEAFMNQSAVAICRREAIDALRDSEANLARAQQISHSGNWDWDVKNKKLVWSEEVYRIFGVQKDFELTFEGIEAMVHPDDREKNKEFVNELLNTVDSADIEFRIIRPDGAVRYVYQNAEIRHDEAGNACRIFGIIQDITARNEVVKALEESEHRFKMLFECAPDAIYLTDMNGNFVDGNKVAEKLIGYKREELIGTNFFEAGLLPPEQVPKALAGLEKNANDEPTGPDEFTLIRKDGSNVSVEIRTFPVRIGNEILALGIARDVTERKLTEEALRESEQKYKELFENAREAIVIIDMDKRITDANKFIKEYGFSKGDLIGRNYLDFVAEEYKEKAIEDFEKLRRGIPQEGEFNVITPKGNIIVYYRDNPIIRDGSVIGVQAVLTDITERKWAEDALRTSEARLSEAMKIAKLGYWEYDVADNVFIFNDQFYSVYRTSAEQVGGYQVSPSRYAELFLHPDDAPKLRKEIRKAVETTDPNFRSEGEHSIIYGDGKIGYVSVRYFVVKDSQGRTVKTHGVNQDITERKKAEGKLREYHAKLKAMTSENLRTEDRERKRFAIGLHDNICQNLVLTKVLLQSVLRLVSDPSVSGPLKMASETMGELIEQANSLTFELSNPILHELGFVLAMKKHLSEEVRKKHGIAFELESDEGLRIPDEEIKSALFRISRELLMNIVKHAQARNVKVSINKRRGQIHLVIQDDGVGFDSSKVGSELFITSRFGIFSIREQLEHLGGSFEIESEPGRGTTATVVVPLGENTVG